MDSHCLLWGAKKNNQMDHELRACTYFREFTVVSID